MKNTSPGKFRAMVKCPACHKYHPVEVSIANTLRRQDHDWSVVDWSLTNKEIAQSLAVTESYVSVMRKRHAASTVNTRAMRAQIWTGVDWSKRNTEIANAAQVDETSVSRARRRYAPETIRRKSK